MKAFVPILVSVLVVLMVVVVLLTSIKLPESSLWRGHVVLYASAQLQEEAVLDILSSEGVQGVVTESSPMPLVVSEFAPVQSIDDAEATYVNQRTNYFFDRSRKMRIFYVEKEYFQECGQAVAQLQQLLGDGAAGMEQIYVYPWPVPVIVGVCLLVFVVLSRSRRFTLLTSLFPMLFSVCMPSYSGAAAAILVMYGFFLCSSFWNRRKMVAVSLRNPLVLLFLVAGIPVAAIGSVLEGALLMAAIIGAFATALLLYHVTMRGGRGFSPVLLRNAELISIVSTTATFTLFIPAIAAVVLCLSFAFFGYFPSDTSVNGLFLPAPARYTEIMSFDSTSYQEVRQQSYVMEELPCLVHYVDWVWDIQSYPYRSLHDRAGMDLANSGETVSMTTYSQTAEGSLQQQERTMLTFDDEFISEAIQYIPAGQPQLETMLRLQNCFTPVVYRRMGDFHDNVGLLHRIRVFVSLLSTVAVSLVAVQFIWREQR